MEVEIAHPSPAQMRKLHMGQPFRAKLGPGLKVSVPQKEAKKMMKASMKGSGATLHGCSCCGCVMCKDDSDSDNETTGKGFSGEMARYMAGFKYPKTTASTSGGNVKATAKDSAKRLMVSGTDRAVRAIDGSGLAPAPPAPPMKGETRPSYPSYPPHGSGVFSQAEHMGAKKAKKAIGGNVKKTAKDSSKRLMVAGTDRAVRALEGSGGRPLARDARHVEMVTPPRSQGQTQIKPAEGGKINRLKKFNKWFKSIGTKVKTLNHNLKPVKEAATNRAADYIKYYNNPEAQTQAGLDMFQKEAGDTGKLFTKGKKRGQSMGSASVPDYEPAPAGLRRGTFIAPPSAPATPPQPVDVNDDGEPDGYFFPNEASWFGAGMKKGMRGVHKAMRQSKKKMGSGTAHLHLQQMTSPTRGSGSGAKKTSPWIAHVKAYCAQHGCKYSDGLKQAKATYKKGGALYPAGYDPRYDY